MIRLRHKLLIEALRIYDQVLLGLTLFLTVAFRTGHYTPGGVGAILRESYRPSDSIGIAILAIGWFWIFNVLVKYDTNRFRGWTAYIRDVVAATSLSSLYLLLISAIFSFNRVNTIVVTAFWAGTTLLGVVSRLVMRWMLMRARRSGFNSRHLLIVGHNEHAMHMAERIQRSPELGYRIVGFIAEEKDTEKPGTGAGKVIGSFSELQSILEKGTVDEVMICLSVSTQFPLVARAVQLARDLGVVVRVYPESSEARLLTDFSIERFEGDCILTLFRERLLFQLFFKRIIDVIVSFVALIVLAPLLVTVALCIKATSPGPVLFVQERVGMNRRKFKLYKFRSMYTDAERRKAEFAHLNEMDGPVFKIKNDPRITPLGRFIRKTSIDELPQLMNVLFGQMSLVGPRPPLPSEVDQYEWLYRKRLSIKPGLTCLWQISGRNTVSFKRWMEMDKEYIERWSIWLDLEILAKTVPVVLFGRGAS